MKEVIIINANFFKAIVIKPDVFESSIVYERHFGTYEEAELFKLNIALNHRDLICVVCEFKAS